jgi:hypothetical protein
MSIFCRAEKYIERQDQQHQSYLREVTKTNPGKTPVIQGELLLAACGGSGVTSTTDSGSSGNGTPDLEAKQIPNLSWDFSPFSNCAPDLLKVTHSATSFVPTSWGSIVQTYLLSHAQ